MIVNIHDYVDRYLNNYVYYHWQHFSDSGESDSATYLFEGKYQEAIDSITASTFAYQLQANEFNNADKSKSAAALDLVDQLANGTLLEETLDQIAASVNTAIDNKVENINFQDLYRAALSYANLLENGHAEYRDIHAFLRILTQTINQAGGYNPQFLSELRTFGRIARGRRFNFNPGDAKIVSQSQLTNLNRIQKALANAVDKFEQSGNRLSATSFRSTIVFIFRQVLSDAIATNLLNFAFQDEEKQINDILISFGFKLQQSLPSQDKIHTKVNAINTDGLQLSVTQNGNTATIEIGTSIQTHWIDSSGSKTSSNIIAKSTIGQMFQDGSPSKFYAYNLIAHRDQFPEEYNIMRASIAASFMRDSIMGANKQQVTQFLMINGHVYPILTIIKNICDEYMRNSGQGSTLGIIIQEPASGSNRWQTDENYRGPNVRLALIRSQLINNIINKLSISLNYNSNILNNYINKT